MPKFYSDVTDDDLSYERVEGFGGGMDAFTRATLLQPNQSQYLENVMIQDNFEARTRPGGLTLGASFGHPIQGALFFSTPTADQLIVASNQGFSYWDGAAWNAMAGFTLHDAALVFSAAQGVDKALFCDGTAVRRWNGASWDAAFGNGPTDPPPDATVLLWHAGRMWAAGFPGTGPAGREADAVMCSAVLTFGTGDWDLTDRSFRVGSGDGDPVIGLASLPASVPEQAVLGVLKSNSIHVVRTDPTQPITNFTDQYAPESVAGGLGVVGPRAFAVFGNDLLYVAPDKSVRSLSRMEAAAGQFQVSPPLSLPLQPFLERVNWNYANLISVVRYRQLALFAVPLDNAVVPNTVLVWNGRLQQWTGIWTGWTPTCFAVSRFLKQQRLVHGDTLGNVRVWQDYADATLDTTYQDDGNAVPTKVWTRSFLFQEPLNDKDPYHCEARFASANALVNFALVGDNASLSTWQKDLTQKGAQLPIQLPFNLQNPQNVPARKGLRGLSPFNEAYLQIESTTGWFSLRNVSLSAFINTLANQ